MKHYENWKISFLLFLDGKITFLESRNKFPTVLEPYLIIITSFYIL